MSNVALSRCSVQDGRVVVAWLTERDGPWLGDLIDVYRAFEGEPRRRLDEHLARWTGGEWAGSGRALAVEVLDRVFLAPTAARVKRAGVRGAVFRAAVQGGLRGEVLARAAGSQGLTQAGGEGALFADRPCERTVRAPPEPPDPSAVARQANLAIAQAALCSSAEIAVELEGDPRAVVRHARLRRLVCTARGRSPGGPVLLEVSGPLALFRRTALYDRHLAELLPTLVGIGRFRLRARCLVRGREGVLALEPSAPLPSPGAPRLYGSLLEQRFARDFARLGSAWEVLREPAPRSARGMLVFPDFALQRRGVSGERWLLEIAGFWTADDLAEKAQRRRAAGLERLIVCLDAALDCGRGALPESCVVLPFARRVDAGAVLRILEGTRPRGPPAAPVQGTPAGGDRRRAASAPQRAHDRAGR
jgi:predicted nuclease of restriction endonuclease-like RecB superfamily